MSDLPSFPSRPRRRSSLSQEIKPESLVEDIHLPSTDAVVEEDSASRNSSPKVGYCRLSLLISRDASALQRISFSCMQALTSSNSRLNRR